MAMVAVTLLCAGVEGFLFYLLTHFARELKKDRAVRSAVAVIPVALAGGLANTEGGELRKVIEITRGSRMRSHDRRRRIAS
jgi:hypothetical protein